MTLIVIAGLLFLYGIYVVFMQPEDRLAGAALAAVAAGLFTYYFRRRMLQRAERENGKH